jgi:hypothetical protein
MASDQDTKYLIEELRAAVDETERNLREGNAQYLRGDAAEVKRRATELSGKLLDAARLGGYGEAV